MDAHKSKRLRAIRGMLTYSLLCFIFIISGVFTLYAKEAQTLRQSIRALGMGNAFVAVVNDENALHYNPAGLQSIEQHIFEILTLSGTVNQNFLDLAEEDSENESEFIGNLVGQKLYFRGDLTLASVSGPGWGYSLFGGVLFDGEIHNPTVPYIELLTYVQSGVVAGFSQGFLDETLDIGVSFKTISRSGIGKRIQITDFVRDDFGDEIEEEFEEIRQSAPDIGMIYHLDQWYNLQTRLAFVAKNIGGMDFGTTGEIPMTFDLGIATQSELAGIDILMAADFIDITYAATEYKSTKRNIKLGMEFGVFKRTNGHHMFSFRMGQNGGYSSFGFSINVPYLPLKIDYAKWSEEVGNIAGDVEDKRQALQLSINF